MQNAAINHGQTLLSAHGAQPEPKGWRDEVFYPMELSDPTLKICQKLLISAVMLLRP